MGAYLAIKSKNLLPYPFGDKGIVTRNGITFTDNGDGSITVNGTATADAYFGLSYNEFLTTSSSQMVACYTGNPVGGSTDTYYIYLPQTGHKITTSYHLSGNPSYWKSLRIIVKSGVTANNVVFRPMLYVYDSSKGYDTNYEPYYRYKKVKALSGIKPSKKNLLIGKEDFIEANNQTKNGITIKRLADGGFELTGTNTQTSGYTRFFLYYVSLLKFDVQSMSFYAYGKTNTGIHFILGDGDYSYKSTSVAPSVPSNISRTGTGTTFNYVLLDIDAGVKTDCVIYPMLCEGTYTTLAEMPNYFEAKKCTIRMRPTTFHEQYQRVEYIESNVNVAKGEYQYIDTGVIGKSGLTAEMKMRWNALQKDGAFLGSRTDVGGAKRIYMCYMYNPNFATEQVGRWYIGYNVLKDTGIAIEKDRDYELKTILKNAKQEFYIDGERVWYEYVGGEVNTGLNLYIFNYNEDNSIISYCATSARLYYLKIYDGDKLVRNFIPCYRKSDGEIGLLDIVSGVFYTNQGTGTFIKGANI